MLQYERMAAAIDRLLNGGSAALSEAAGATCLSPFYFQRQFRRFVGVSPHRFTAALKLNDIKARLKKGDDILTATWDAGLSGGGRAHDLFITHEAVTPGEFRRRGKNISITHGVSATPFGKVFIASTARGVCLLRFIDTTTPSAVLDELHRLWPQAKTKKDNQAAHAVARRMFSGASAKTPLHVIGTNFQMNVWWALLAVPVGCIVSYGAVAKALGKPKAGQAIGRAAAANPVAILIPCHRLLSQCGDLTGYAWGIPRKRALLAKESLQSAPLKLEQTSLELSAQ